MEKHQKFFTLIGETINRIQLDLNTVRTETLWNFKFFVDTVDYQLWAFARLEEILKCKIVQNARGVNFYDISYSEKLSIV